MRVRDACLVELSELTSLKSVGPGNTCVNDSGLRQLRGLSRLAFLTLHGTAVTG